MVLAALAAALICLLLASCHRPAPATVTSVVIDEAIVAETALQIIVKDDVCLVKEGESELMLEPKPPCYFLRREGKVQSFPYKDRDVNWLAIIAGTPASQATRKAWNLSPADQCGERSQAVMMQAGGLAVSKSSHTGGVYCKEKGVDEKEFWSFAHESLRY